MTRTGVVVLAGACVLATGAFVAAPVEQAAVRITKDPQGYWFTEGDTKVLFYQAERKALPDGQAARSNYFHPLYDLDGNVLTEDFPKDHIHHRGIFWAWHQVRINGTTVQDQWANRDSFWTVQDAQIDSDARSASLALRVVWESPLFTDAQGQRRPFVEERSVTRVHRAEGAIRKIDFHQRLTALVDGVEIGGSDDAKGYGGFSYRVVMPPDIRFTGPQGVVTPIENAVEFEPVDGCVGELWGVGEERPDGPDAPEHDGVPAALDPPRAEQHAECRLPRSAARRHPARPAGDPALSHRAASRRARAGRHRTPAGGIRRGEHRAVSGRQTL